MKLPWLLCRIAGVWVVAGLFGAGAEMPAMPLEANGHARLTSSAEISAFLADLERSYPQARVETVGTSVQGRPLEALVLSAGPGADVTTVDRLTVVIVGSQHGMESAGAESLQYIARDLLAGPLRPLLDDIDVVLIPNANPDGRELRKRANANGINLNIDFVALTQPESRALVRMLERYRPEVVLDVHESAVLKLKSLAREGYMTDFWAQVEIANNPNVPAGLREFSIEQVLNPWIDAINAAGLRAHRYIGEIRSSRQPITNGGLTLRNLRNRAGIEGVLSFLMETRLDPSKGRYPTFRNIGARVDKQRICIEAFLRRIHARRDAALATVQTAQRADTPLQLSARYAPDPAQPTISIELRRIADDRLEAIEFADHRRIETAQPLVLPRAYLVTAHHAEIAALLERQFIAYTRVAEPRRIESTELVIGPPSVRPDVMLSRVAERRLDHDARPGDLWVETRAPRGRLAALLFEPRSASSIYRTAEYFPIVRANGALPVQRVP